MRVLLDTNVVLDVLLDRTPWRAEMQPILDAARQSRFIPAVTSLCVANVFYVARRVAGLDRARQTVRDCLDAFEVIPVGRGTLEAADRLPGSDFEDNVQMASAVEAGIDAILTRDAGGFAASPLPVWSPGQFVSNLAQR